jgi:DME family drug/metabolite transporter
MSVLTAQKASRPGVWLILLAATLWGTVGVTTQALYHLTATNALSIGFFRLALATPALALSCFGLIGWRMFWVARRDLAIIALLGLMLALYQVCYFGAIALVGVAIATLVTLCSAPVLVALISTLLTGERPSRVVMLALALAIAGVALIVGFQPGAHQQAVNPDGVALALGSALGYALVTLSGRAVARRYQPLQINAIAFAAGALALLPAAALTGPVVTYPPVGWALLLYLGLVPSALAYGLFLTGMRSTPATVASVLTLMEPLTATVLAAVLFGERLGALGLVGGALLLCAILVLALASGPKARDEAEGVAAPHQA